MRHRLATLTFTIVMISLGLAVPASAAVTESTPATSALAPDSEMPRNPERQSYGWSERIDRDPAPTALLTLSCAQDTDRPGWSTPVRLVEPPALGGWILEVDIPVPGGAAAADGYEYVLVAGDQVMHRTGCTAETLWPWQEFPAGGSAIETGKEAVTVLPAGVLGALLPGEEAPAAAPTTPTTSAVTGSADGSVSPVEVNDPGAEASASGEDPEANLDSPELREGASGTESSSGSPITATYWIGLAIAAIATAISRARDRERVLGERRPAGRHPVAAGVGGLIAVGAGIVAVTGLRAMLAGALLAVPPGLLVGWALAGRVASTHLFADHVGKLITTGWRNGRNATIAWGAGSAVAAWLIASGSSRLPAMVFAGLAAGMPAAAAQGARAEIAYGRTVDQYRDAVAAILGVSPIALEDHRSVHIDGDNILVDPVPSTGMRTAADRRTLDERVAQILPGYAVADTSAHRMVLVPAGLDVREQRATREASGGLVEEVTSVAPPVAQPTSPDDTPSLVFDPNEEL
jgi:hypothetical protein